MKWNNAARELQCMLSARHLKIITAGRQILKQIHTHSNFTSKDKRQRPREHRQNSYRRME